jgi:hypothetical protein
MSSLILALVRPVDFWYRRARENGIVKGITEDAERLATYREQVKYDEQVDRYEA